jgi:DNA-binding beta-propeller fold protein YncE
MGRKAPHLDSPSAVAVDQESHDIYVADLEAGTVSKFDENPAQLGIGVFA